MLDFAPSHGVEDGSRELLKLGFGRGIAPERCDTRLRSAAAASRWQDR
jgi:hypothetical protein